MTEGELRSLLEEILDTQHKCVSRRGRGISTLSSPITDQELQRLVDHLAGRGIRIPPSYGQLLKVSNGIPSFRFLESADTNDHRWRNLCQGGVGPVHRFVIGFGDVTRVCAFDPDTADDAGELRLLEFAIEGNPPKVHESLEAFLHLELKHHQQGLVDLEANRARRKRLLRKRGGSSLAPWSQVRPFRVGDGSPDRRYFLPIEMRRGLASMRLPTVRVSTPSSSLASTFSPSAESGSEKLREKVPYWRSYT